MAEPHANPPRIVVPIVRADVRCGEFDPNTTYSCRRPAGHTGRHAFFWLHANPGLVRRVWP